MKHTISNKKILDNINKARKLIGCMSKYDVSKLILDTNLIPLHESTENRSIRNIIRIGLYPNATKENKKLSAIYSCAASLFLLKSNIKLILQNAMIDQSIDFVILSRKGFNPNDVKLIANILPFTSISALNLSSNNVGDECIKCLSAIPTLRSLCICNTNIGNEGAKFLAKNKNLKEISLLSNNVNDEGAGYF